MVADGNINNLSDNLECLRLYDWAWRKIEIKTKNTIISPMIKILVDRMKTEIVTFTFTKVDGTIRVARGTLRNDVLPQTNGTGRPTPENIQVYYDVDKKSWRSFKKDNLIGIIK